MADYAVVWNGRKDSPGGRQLFAVEHETQAVTVFTPSHVCPHCGGPKALAKATYCRSCYMEIGRRSSKP